MCGGHARKGEVLVTVVFDFFFLHYFRGYVKKIEGTQQSLFNVKGQNSQRLKWYIFMLTLKGMAFR